MQMQMISRRKSIIPKTQFASTLDSVFVWFDFWSFFSYVVGPFSCDKTRVYERRKKRVHRIILNTLHLIWKINFWKSNEKDAAEDLVLIFSENGNKDFSLHKCEWTIFEQLRSGTRKWVLQQIPNSPIGYSQWNNTFKENSIIREKYEYRRFQSLCIKTIFWKS